MLDLLIHEFGHHYEGNHLSEDYYRALTRIGGEFAALALREPAIFFLAAAAEKVVDSQSRVRAGRRGGEA